MRLFTGVYRVARDDFAFRDLLFEFVSPPPTIRPAAAAAAASASATGVAGGSGSSADLMQMGFPALLTTTYPGVCACHGKLKTTGYGCPRCRARLCDVPTECRVCALTVVNAPQLARSYRHLFPVRSRISHSGVFGIGVLFAIDRREVATAAAPPALRRLPARCRFERLAHEQIASTELEKLTSWPCSLWYHRLSITTGSPSEP